MTEQPMTATMVSGTPRQAKVDGHRIMGDSQGRGGGEREREREGDELKSRERVVLSEDDMTDM